MSYGKFTIDEIKLRFGIPNTDANLFPEIKLLEPSEWLAEALRRASKMKLKSEKSRSEFVIAPILSELKEKNLDIFTFYSGDNLDADKKEGLNGECDFILSKNTGSLEISVPIFCLVEAEKNDFTIGMPQCMAQMIGARVYNQKRNQNIETIYGCVTTGTEWRFLKLEGSMIYVHQNQLFINELPKILGVLQTIIDEYK